MENAIEIEALKERISSMPGVAAVYIFGSAVKGTIKKDSDIDLALLFDDAHAARVDKLGLMAELSKAAGRDVDVIIINTAEPRLFHEILSTGRMLLERDRECRIRHEVRNRRLYEDYRKLHAIYMKGMKARHG